jgi:hypothetical protein
MGKTISLRVQSLRAKARKVVKQIGTPCLPDPIMRRPCADREEKRVTRRSDTIRTQSDQEQLDLHNPNQRRLLAPLWPFLSKSLKSKDFSA